MAKHWTRQELLRKFGETGAAEANDSNPQIGYPPKPKNLPRTVSKRWNEVAQKLYRKGLLWTWSYDGKLLLDLVGSDDPEEQREIVHEFGCRQANEDPRKQIAKMKAVAAYWVHFSWSDFEQLRLTHEEALALADWVANPPAKVESTSEEIAAAEASAKNSQEPRTPGMPKLPEDLTPILSALWKTAVMALMFGQLDPESELMDLLHHDPSAQSFFVDRMQEALPYLQRGLKPRV